MNERYGLRLSLNTLGASHLVSSIEAGSDRDLLLGRS